MKEYPTGNAEILQMIAGGSFDEILAEKLLLGTDLNAPICDLSGNSTTYLYEAESENNLPAVAFLLAHGADPNLNDPDLICDCALWDLQYLDEGQDWETRYEIAKLFFQYGADPNLESDGESLYDYVLFKVYNDDFDNINDYENICHLYKLLVIFGGGRKDGVYRKPDLKNVDPNKVDSYDVIFLPHEDGYHICGFLVDDEENTLGRL